MLLYYLLIEDLVSGLEPRSEEHTAALRGGWPRAKPKDEWFTLCTPPMSLLLHLGCLAAHFLSSSEPPVVVLGAAAHSVIDRKTTRGGIFKL